MPLASEGKDFRGNPLSGSIITASYFSRRYECNPKTAADRKSLADKTGLITQDARRDTILVQEQPVERSSVFHLAARWQRPEVLESIFDHLSDALFFYDESLHVVGVNQSAQRLFGMTADDMIGKHCQDLFRRGDCEPGGDSPHDLNGSSWLASGTFSLHTNHGRDRMAVVRTVQLLDEAGTLQGMIATVRDNTKEAAPATRQIIAESPAMLKLLEFVRRVAVSEATSILIEGENGTGKDLIAKALHYLSMRQSEPFVAINCAAIPATLLESELFGYERGAFTDARAQKLGLFELADKGTLFLDEVGELPHALQSKLLRVLEDQSFRRLGGLRDITIDVRIIAATNKNLANAVKEGAFRQDLYYRLNVIQLTVPPLKRAIPGHTAAGAIFHRTLQPEVQTTYRGHFRGSREPVGDAPLAGQCAGTAQRDRACHDP